MANGRSRTNRAATLHRRAAATAAAATDILDEIRPAPADQRRQYELADRLRAAAAVLAPGWSGGAFGTLTPETPSGDAPSAFVRVGTAAPLDDARFPALVPLVGTGHLTVDADARDPRVAGLLRAVLLRVLAAAPAGSLLVRAVDGTAGETFAPFAPLADAGLFPPAATDLAGLGAVLTEAEQWVASGSARQRRHDRTMLLVVAALPAGTGPADLVRIEALAAQGHAAGLHLVVAGWPAPRPAATEPTSAAGTVPAQPTGAGADRPPSGERRHTPAGNRQSDAGAPAGPEREPRAATGRAPLPYATAVAMRNAYALLADPPGASFSSRGADPPAGLNSPVFVDEAPPVELVDAVCRRLARRVAAGSRLALSDLLPPATDPLWGADATNDLSTVVGDADGRPVMLTFSDLTPHWLVSGRSAADRSAFLTDVLFGLTARYGPDELACYLVDLADDESFVEFLQTQRDRSWVPQVRAAAMAADREYVLDLFGQLEAELHQREEAGRRAGGQRFAELRQHQRLPRIVCVIDSFPLLVAPRDPLAAEAASRLDALARAGRAYGIHLILAGDGDPGIGSGPATRDSTLGQFPVRVALPGGGAVLEPTNDAAAGLAVGSAVVNTAGGLGGPRGATRGHERMVRFPDPYDDPDALAELRHRLWSARPEGSTPPVVFAGYARPLLANDPRHRAAVAGRAHGPAALLGRAVDVRRTTVSVPLGPAAGRNLAVLGTGWEAAELLGTAARSVAAHHEPGTARFVIAPLDEASATLAAALAADLAERQTVETVPDAAGLLAAADSALPGYLVVFGADGPDPLPAERLRTLLREGPPAGLHLLGWWRTVPPLRALLDPDGEVGKIAAVAVVDVPGAQLASLFGRPVQWRPRPDRAVLWDGPDETGTVLVPFAAEGAAT